MAKPTYLSIARRAGVGTATVERVLNGRGGVREATAEKVVRAARELDWPGRLPDKHRGVVIIEVMLVRPDSSFFVRLSNAFRRISASLDPTLQVQVTFLDETDPLAITQRILSPARRRAGLVVSVPDHPAIRDALGRVHAAGIPVVQVVTRALAEAAFVGIDNYAAGRMAGLMMARLGAVQGTVVAVCHSAIYQVHRDRIRGFTDYLSQHRPEGLKFAHIYFGRDDPRIGKRAVIEAAREWGDLAGIYNAGGANAGQFEAMRLVRSGAFFVGHELTDVTREALRTGVADVVFDQLPEAQARRSIDLLLSRLGYIEGPIDNPPIQFATLTAENV